MANQSASVLSFIGTLSAAGIQVIDDADTLGTFAADASDRYGAIPFALVRPSDSAQVQQIVKGAVASRVPLIPVSSPAGPRRRGDTVSDTQTVIVDLSGMSRVIHVDGRNAIALIEAGVTFPQFAAALLPHGLRPYQPLIPRASKSVLTAFLEREPMTVPGKHWDSADPLAAMEVIFGSGDLFRTGGAAMPGSLENNLAGGNRQMVSLGPAHTDFGRLLQGAQGALGIVTWASIYCQRIPAVELPLFATSDAVGPLIELCYSLLRRRIDGQLFILNNIQLALMLARDAGHFATLKTSLPPWAVYVELNASSYFPDEAIAYQRALLEADAARLKIDLVSQLAGQPASEFAARQRAYPAHSCYERANFTAQEVLFLSQLDRIPSHIAALSGLADGIDNAIYLQPMTQGVNAHCQFGFLGTSGQSDMLGGVARRAAERCAEGGGFFSRPYHPWAAVPFNRDPAIRSLLARAKNMLDPHSILQPGALSLGAAA